LIYGLSLDERGQGETRKACTLWVTPLLHNLQFRMSRSRPASRAIKPVASSDGGQGPVDAAIRSAASQAVASDLPKLSKFVPFDSAMLLQPGVAPACNAVYDKA
jgi:hypothetical protein